MWSPVKCQKLSGNLKLLEIRQNLGDRRTDGSSLLLAQNGDAFDHSSPRIVDTIDHRLKRGKY